MIIIYKDINHYIYNRFKKLKIMLSMRNTSTMLVNISTFKVTDAK